MKNLFFTICLGMFFSILFAQETVVVGWTFPANSADIVADTGIAMNLDKELSTLGGTSQIQFKNGYETKAAQATGWDDGAGEKAWKIGFSTLGYGTLKLYSRQQSGGNEPGPRDYKVQYKIGESGTWTDVAGLENIEVQNDWTTAFIDNAPLPEECNNQEVVFLRWVMTTNISSNGGNVTPDGKSKIDDIFVKGTVLSGLEEYLVPEVYIFPNPATEFVTIEMDSEINSVSIISITGQLIQEKEIIDTKTTLNVSGLEPGLYFLSITNITGLPGVIRKLYIW
ncbi:MAG: T9SS type A sorting domain-containing protein [Bacteroidales bacterium]|nr:T9SS type A sorting domain-containing protein [Bacteroidales bacterium]